MSGGGGGVLDYRDWPVEIKKSHKRFNRISKDKSSADILNGNLKFVILYFSRNYDISVYFQLANVLKYI